jgi:hypothetical protein
MGTQKFFQRLARLVKQRVQIVTNPLSKRDFDQLHALHARSLDTLARLATAFQKSACETQLRELLREPRYANPRRLERYAFKIFSQNGEDGTLQEILRRIGTTNKRFVEFGVQDGLECNTHFLLYSGWEGLWIEGNEAAAAKIREVFAGPLSNGSLKLEHRFVTAENINAIISVAQFTGEIDLLSVDMDGKITTSAERSRR